MKSKSLLFVMIGFLFLSVLFIKPVECATIYLYNGSFELGNLGYWDYDFDDMGFPTWSISDQARLGSFAVENWDAEGWIWQYIDRLPSNWLDNVTFSVKVPDTIFGDNVDVVMDFVIGYTDGVKEIYSTDHMQGSSSWNNVTVSGFVKNKFVEIIAFKVYQFGVVRPIIVFDDVVFNYNSDFEVLGSGGWSFVLSSPVIDYTSLGFEAYQKTDYILTISLLNASGHLDTSLSGEYFVFSPYFGNIQDYFEGGVIEVVINGRGHIQTFNENLGFLILPDGANSLEFVIVATWVHPEDMVVDSSDAINLYDVLGDESMKNYAVTFLFIGIPAFIIGSFGASNGFAIEGALIGVVVGTFTAYLGNLVDILFLFAVSVVVVAFVLMSRSGQ